MKALMLENYLVLKAKDSRNNFSLNDSVWFLSKDVKLNFSYFESNINANLLASIKKHLHILLLILVQLMQGSFSFL